MTETTIQTVLLFFDIASESCFSNNLALSFASFNSLLRRLLTYPICLTIKNLGCSKDVSLHYNRAINRFLLQKKDKNHNNGKK